MGLQRNEERSNAQNVGYFEDKSKENHFNALEFNNSLENNNCSLFNL
jgi:hypothetical protein